MEPLWFSLRSHDGNRDTQSSTTRVVRILYEQLLLSPYFIGPTSYFVFLLTNGYFLSIANFSLADVFSLVVFIWYRHHSWQKDNEQKDNEQTKNERVSVRSFFLHSPSRALRAAALPRERNRRR
jgi:hypothetical protein